MESMEIEEKLSFNFREKSEVTTDSAEIMPVIMKARFLSKGLDREKILEKN